MWDDALASYRFHENHPLNPRRLELTLELIRRLGRIGAEDQPIVPPRIATEAEVLLAHDAAFVDAVKHAVPGSHPGHGLGTEDVPIVAGMHEAALRIAGATLTAADEVMSGRARRAFSMAGGLHHARRSEAAGFCIYNDLAIAIRWMQEQHGARVLYLDIDAHHGDGVQSIFYEDPEVLTISLHESGAFLFPGTGFVDEVGTGDGVGYSVNVPLDAHTEDASFEAAFDRVVPRLARAFRPDVIVIQAGCDAHVLDPLTHLRCTTGLYERLLRATCELADELCEGRVVATGGGGYAIHTVVPRAWTLVWAALCGIEVPDELPADWLRALRLESGNEVPTRLRDPVDAFAASPRRAQAERTNAHTVDALLRRVVPEITGWGLAF